MMRRITRLCVLLSLRCNVTRDVTHRTSSIAFVVASCNTKCDVMLRTSKRAVVVALRRNIKRDATHHTSVSADVVASLHITYDASHVYACFCNITSKYALRNITCDITQHTSMRAFVVVQHDMSVSAHTVAQHHTHS